MSESRIKRARESRVEDILGAHKAEPSALGDGLVAAMAEMRRRFPGLGVTLLVFDVGRPDGDGPMPGHLHYISSAERADMVALMRAFVEHGDHSKLARMADAPPTQVRQ